MLPSASVKEQRSRCRCPWHGGVIAGFLALCVVAAGVFGFLMLQTQEDEANSHFHEAGSAVHAAIEAEFKLLERGVRSAATAYSAIHPDNWDFHDEQAILTAATCPISPIISFLEAFPSEQRLETLQGLLSWPSTYPPPLLGGLQLQRRFENGTSRVMEGSAITTASSSLSSYLFNFGPFIRDTPVGAQYQASFQDFTAFYAPPVYFPFVGYFSTSFVVPVAQRNGSVCGSPGRAASPEPIAVGWVGGSVLSNDVIAAVRSACSRYPWYSAVRWWVVNSEYDMLAVASNLEGRNGQTPELLTPSEVSAFDDDDHDDLPTLSFPLELSGSWHLYVRATRDFDAEHHNLALLVLGVEVPMVFCAAVMVMLVGWLRWKGINRKMDTLSAASAAAREARIGSERAIGYVSHEMRNPLNVIVGTLDLLPGSESPASPQSPSSSSPTSVSATCAAHLHTLRGAAEQLRRQVDDLLQVQKLKHGHINISAGRVSLQQLVADVLQEHRNLSPVPMRAAIAPDTPGVVWLDSARVRQLVTNGLSNAIKHTLRGGIEIAVTVTNSPCEPSYTEAEDSTEEAQQGKKVGHSHCRAAGRCLTLRKKNKTSSPAAVSPYATTTNTPTRYVRIDVRDSGEGLHGADPATLFQPFTSTASLSSHMASTGLGLPICHLLATAMGGTVRLQQRPAPATGCVFTVSLPLELPPPVSEDEESSWLVVSGHDKEEAGDRRPSSITTSVSRPHRLWQWRNGVAVGHIMVVDDSKTTAQLAAGLLQRLGCRCTIVTQGFSGSADKLRAAIAAERDGECPVAAVLVDIHLGVVSGIDVMTALKAGLPHPQPYFVAASGAVADEDVRAYRRSGFHGVLPKPYSLATLKAMLNTVLMGNPFWPTLASEDAMVEV